jgi:hypothetical protein
MFSLLPFHILPRSHTLHLPPLPSPHHSQPNPSLRVDEREARRIAATFGPRSYPMAVLLYLNYDWRRLGAPLG